MERPFTHRIRRCNGNPDMFLLVRLTADGKESDLDCDRFTSSSLFNLTRWCPSNLKPREGDRIEPTKDV